MKVTEALSKEQLDQYLLRIRLHHPDAADLTTLEAVVHGHTHSIPFENLSLTHPLAVPTNGEPGNLDGSDGHLRQARRQTARRLLL